MADDVPRVFVDPTIQALYDDLQLRRSGIEEIDDIYANLEKGSRNHLRAFIRTLDRQGGEYVPTYLAVAEYEAIVNSTTERGWADA